MGQIPIGYDEAKAQAIKDAFRVLDENVPSSNGYNRFSQLLTDLILDVENPDISVDRPALEERISGIKKVLDNIEKPYEYVTAASILMEVVAKLGLGADLLANDNIATGQNTSVRLFELRCFVPGDLFDLVLGRHLSVGDK